MMEMMQKLHFNPSLIIWVIFFTLLTKADSMIQLSKQDVRQLCYDAQKMANSGSSDEDIGETLSGRIEGFMRIGPDDDALPTEKLMLKSLAKSLLHRQNENRIPSSLISVQSKIKSEKSLVSHGKAFAQDNAVINGGATLVDNTQSELKFKKSKSIQKFIEFTIGKRRKRDAQIMDVVDKSPKSCSCDSLPSITVDKSRLTEFLENLKNLQDECEN